jgi:site-specific DNA-methyltransferase (adenine-specific)
MWCFGSMRMFLDRSPEFTGPGWKLSQDVVWEKHNPSGPDADRFRRIHEHALHWYRGPWSGVHHEAQKVTTGIVERGRVVNQGAKSIGQRGTYANNGWTDDGTRLLTSVIRARSMHRIGSSHPTEKPVGILQPLIEYACPPGGLALDPMCGSASTLEAARLTGRRAIGIERHEPYIEAAAKRLSQGVLGVGS